MQLGKMTLELQQELRPVIGEILEDFGQDFVISRSGFSPVTSRGLVYQLEDRATVSSQVDDAHVKVNAWQGIFSYDAPLIHPYYITDAEGQIYIPDSITNDPGRQDVARFAHLAALVDRTRVDTLIFQTGGLVQDPKTKNWKPGSGTPITIDVRLVSSSDPVIRETVGADVSQVALVGRWGSLLEPKSRPSKLVWGESSPLIISGQPGTIVLKQSYPDEDLFTEQQYGERFLAVWRSDARTG